MDSLLREVGINCSQPDRREEGEQAQCMLGVLEMGIVGADKRGKVCLSLFTYCSPASWPQSQSEVSVESAGAWGEEEER